MNYHYLDSNNQPAGPASLEEIRALASAGTIAADPMVCAVGASEWKLLSAVSGGGAPASKSLPIAGTLLGDFVGKGLSFVSGRLSPALVEKSLGLAKFVGQYAVLAGAALTLVLTIVMAIKDNSFAIFLSGLGLVVAIAVGQFCAQRFLGASDALIASTPSRVSSLAFLECVGLLAVLGAIAALVLGIVKSIQIEDAQPLIPAVLLTVFLGFFGAIALHPKLASVESGSGSAGEEAIGILAFFLKAQLKLVPLFFGLLAVVGAVVIVVGMFDRYSSLAAPLEPFKLIPGMFGLYGAGFAGAGAVLVASLLPLLAYLAFLLASLTIELWRAILSVPGKLDALRR